MGYKRRQRTIENDRALVNAAKKEEVGAMIQEHIRFVEEGRFQELVRCGVICMAGTEQESKLIV